MSNYGLLDRDFCLQKISELLHLVSRLRDGDYPHMDSKTALDPIEAVFVSDRQLLESVDEADDPAVILEYCRRANINIARLHPFLGMIIRSSHIRNAFEIYFPLKFVATKLVAPGAQMVLSSEWYFSPYTYPAALKELPAFIFIGVPASECQNPLVVPLSGHELGHVVWQRNGAKTAFDATITAAVVAAYKANWKRFATLFSVTISPDRLESDMFLRRIWAQSYRLASRQLEEVFCDFIGVYLFGRSFLYSFRYLLAPSLGQYRATSYPSLGVRSRYLKFAADHYGVKADEGYDQRSFSDAQPALSPNDEFILEMADTVTESLYPQLLPLVDAYKGNAKGFAEGAADEDRMRQNLKMLIPPMPVDSLSALINASWDIRLDLQSWKILESKVGSDRDAEKLRVLRDLTLKGFEVFEYQRRLEGNASKRA